MILLVAVGVSLPLMLGPVRTNDSHWINIVWADQFTAEMARGVAWPRWLPASHDGLGAPVFYFYGPVAFWIAGLFGLAGAGAWTSLTFAACAVLIASGVTMYLYLDVSAPRRLAGALVYMLAPYHMLDFAQRGALAEFAAFAWIPLIALGTRRAADGRRSLLAGAYAGLILTHLPTTVLASVFLLPLLAWIEARRDVSRWIGIGSGLAGGAALAAAYLLPALTLQGATAMATMHSLAVYQPADWSILAIRLDEAPGLLLIHGIAVAAMLVALAAWRERSGRLWAGFVLAMAMLSLGAIPPLWRLPAINQVQFPWRLLVLLDFGLAMLAAQASLRKTWRLIVAAIPLAALSLLVLSLPASPSSIDETSLLRRHPDVIEYLPRGVGEPVAIYSPWALALAKRTPAAHFDGSFTTVRRFAFPIWQVRCDAVPIASGPAPGTGLLRYRGRACTIERRRLPVEWIGIAISSAMLLMIALGAGRRHIHSMVGFGSERPRTIFTAEKGSMA